ATRMDEGDEYPPYSSFRADPLGAKAFYIALQALPNHPVKVERHFRSLDRLSREPSGQANDLHQTLLVLLGEEPRLWSWNPPRSRLEAIEQAPRAGAPVFIALRSTDSVPTVPPFAKTSGDNDPKPADSPAPPTRRGRVGPPPPTPTPNPGEQKSGEDFF